MSKVSTVFKILVDKHNTLKFQEDVSRFIKSINGEASFEKTDLEINSVITAKIVVDEDDSKKALSYISTLPYVIHYSHSSM